MNSAFQPEPVYWLPGGYSVSVTYATVDNDPGDPEVGPQPDVRVTAVYWELRNSALGVGITACVRDHRTGEWVQPTPGEQDTYDALMTEFQGDRFKIDAVMGWLHEEGLI